MYETREGKRVPEATFRTREGDRWVDVTTRDLFAGKRVVCFALPGAFTPTCSSAHLPRYNELVPAFKSSGVDDILCISVNDSFVMNAWKKDQNADAITFVPDGNGEFTQGMGMLVEKSDLGFGKRSWRYSMLVVDGVVEKMFIEPEVEGDPFEVSDADTMLEYVAPDTGRENITIFTRQGCPHCARAKALLQQRGKDFEEIVVGKDTTAKSLRAVSGADTVPQVFIDGRLIGGADALESYFAAVA